MVGRLEGERITGGKEDGLRQPRQPDSQAVSVAGFEVMVQRSGWATGAESQTAGRCPLPGSGAGAKFKHPASHKSSPFRNRDILSAFADLAQAHDIKAAEGLFLHVIMEPAAELIIDDPLDMCQVPAVLGDLERSLKAQTNLLRRGFLHG